MRRDVVLIALVVLVAAVAAADALRRTESESAPPPPATTETTTRSGFRAHVLSGRLVYTGRSCEINAINLASGTAVPIPERDGCGLWTPRATMRIAHGVGSPQADLVSFEVADLQNAQTRFGPFNARWDSIVWRPDGERLAWCDRSGRGWELEIGATEPRRLRRGCAAGYTLQDEPFFLRGRRLFIDDLVARFEPRPITFAAFGEEYSVALVFGREAVVYRSFGDTAPIARVRLPPFRASPIFAPNNCAVLLRSPHTGEPPHVHFVSLGCPGVRANARFTGNEAAWSPDGTWFAISNVGTITFHRTSVSARDEVRMHAWANQIAWQED